MVIFVEFIESVKLPKFNFLHTLVEEEKIRHLPHPCRGQFHVKHLFGVPGQGKRWSPPAYARLGVSVRMVLDRPRQPVRGGPRVDAAPANTLVSAGS
ncbi:hypothetical protein [Streptomyces chilikensis]|uniref:Uncharacterized protein n=1 Tax=Streptomyces chilikensis TaxID=1194079 RepID=A0ABV3EJ66_9ACTN